MKNLYFVAVTTEKRADREYHAAAVEAVPASYNLAGYLRHRPNVSIFHFAESRKAARELADFWNECYKNNGSYLFAEGVPEQ